MKINKKTTSTKTKILLSVLGVALIVIISGLIYVYGFNGSLFGYNSVNNDSSVNLDSPTDEEKSTGDNTKSDSLDEGKNEAGSSDTPPSPVEQDNGKSVVEVIITAANQNDSILQVRSSISTVTSSGTCTLTLTKGSATITKTTAVQPLPTTSTCKGFDIPTSELSTGTWKLSLQFENDTLTGTTSREVTVQ